MNRRRFLGSLCLGSAALALPRVSFARAGHAGRFVFVLLRGGFDGLAAVVPQGDPDYARLRGAMAYDPDDLTELDGTFGLAPGLAPLAAFWQRGELVALHAMAIPYRTRSHFDGQAVLETGMNRPLGSADGWLNRLLQVLPPPRTGIAVASGLPRSLAGPIAVETWSPAKLGAVDDDYLGRLATLYRADRDLQGRFEAALQQQMMIGEEPAARGAARREGAESLLRAAARILRADGGPNVAELEFSGWDTHANQGMAGGALDRLLGNLADALVAFRDELQTAWAGTTVVVMTEFGRTARPNGTRGTDHGTAGAGFVLGSTLARSIVRADWPGLSEAQLFEARDLKPTLDTRSVLKGALAGTFDLTADQADRVFPDSAAAPGAYDLMK